MCRVMKTEINTKDEGREGSGDQEAGWVSERRSGAVGVLAACAVCPAPQWLPCPAEVSFSELRRRNVLPTPASVPGKAISSPAGPADGPHTSSRRELLGQRKGQWAWDPQAAALSSQHKQLWEHWIGEPC